MDKQPVGQLPDLTQSNNDDEIMVITNDEYNQLKKEKISDFITDLTSTDADNSLVKGDDGKLFVSKTINASDVDGVLSLDNIPQLTANKLPETGISADNYSYPSSITVNDRGQVVSIVEGSAAEAGAYLDQSQISNCLLEVPQNIKYELNDGTLTIKAGTIITVPYGTTDQSTTYPVGATFLNNNFKVVKTYFNNNKFFVQAEVQADINYKPTWLNDERTFITINCNPNYLIGSIVHTSTSGTTTPNNPSVGALWYDTTNNYMKQYNSSQWVDNIAFPLSIITGNNTGIREVTQVFNGMGYIGSTVFALPGLKWLAPNGKNADGSNNNVEGHLEYVYVEQMLNTSVKLLTFYYTSEGEVDIGLGVYFDYVDTAADMRNLTSGYYAYVRDENQMYVNGSKSGSPLFGLLGRVNIVNSNGSLQITDLQFNTTFLAADDQTVVHKEGNEIIYGEKTFENRLVLHEPTKDLIFGSISNPILFPTISFRNSGVDWTNLTANQKGARLISIDKNGEWFGTFQTTVRSSNNDLLAYIGVRRSVNGVEKRGYINAVVQADGTAWSECPTYTNYADSSTKIVTTAYMANHWVTSKPTTSSTASKARPAVVVQNYVSGYNWYRVWSDGWIEQGGRAQVVVSSASAYPGTENVTVINLLKAFSNANYFTSFTFERYSSTDQGRTDDTTALINAIATNSVTVFCFDGGGNKYNTYLRWSACGY